MAYLHSRKVIHGDLKSTNILLQEDFLPKVCDFGLIQMVSGRPGGNVGVVVETPGYTAPEAVANNKYTEKSDVYSYGVVLLELITGAKAVWYVREKATYLRDWAIGMHTSQRGRDVIDQAILKSCLWPEYIDKALKLAIVCVDGSPNARPTMADVASTMEGLCPVLAPLRRPPQHPPPPLHHHTYDHKPLLQK